MYLAINAGSSSVKCRLYSKVLAEIVLFHLKNYSSGQYFVEISFGNNQIKEQIDGVIFNQPFPYILQKCAQLGIIKSDEKILGTVHRLVHGGEQFIEPTEITDDVYAKLVEFTPFAPLHNPIALEKILQAKKICNAKQFAVFDTAFHKTVAKEQFLYGLPYGYYENLRVRKYGFHGISYSYLVHELKIKNYNQKTVIACHLGSGSSVCAIKEGKSISHSFGFTPDENLIMATRSGEVDYDAVVFIKDKLSLNDKDISTLLNLESGLLGISGYSKDMKILIDDYTNNSRAKLAVDMYVQKVVDYIAQFYVLLQGCELLVFTGGIGVASAPIRRMIIEKLMILDMVLDDQKNEESVGHSSLRLISHQSSKTKILTVQTDEEMQMIREVFSKTTV